MKTDIAILVLWLDCRLHNGKVCAKVFTTIYTQKLQHLTDPAVIAAIITAATAAVASIISAILGRTNQNKLKDLEMMYSIFRSQRVWKEQSLSELLGPVNMLLDRTDSAFKRWKPNSLFLEAEIIAKSNSKIRDLTS